MANKKISELTDDPTPTSDDLIATVDDVAGTPTTKKSTIGNLFASLQKMVFGTDAGSNDTYTATLTPAPSAYVTGQAYRFKANTANTGACSIDFNGLGAKTIKKAAGGITTDLADNDIRAGQWVDLVYDGTNMQMQSNLGNAAASGISGLTAGTFPKAASGTTLTNSSIVDNNPEITFTNRNIKTNQIYSSAPNTVTTNDYYLDRFNGLRIGSDVAGFGFADAYFDNVGRHAGFLKPVSTSTGGGATFAFPNRTYTQITANQNNYSITENFFIRLSSDASRDITGMQNATNDPFSGRQADGEVHLIVNVGSNNIVLKHQDTNSTDVNRFLCSTGADITLGADQAADVIYDGTTQRWRVFKKN